ncbi:hypothetical protein BDQ17DRAFT_1342284 [Cyathus striatus]|nr:hypothetical protein BDQ17DRAFT_1342284 [Cyathus striatus]
MVSEIVLPKEICVALTTCIVPQTQGSFKVLSLNVAGLPGIHVYRTPTSGGVPLGSGLNTLSDYSYLDFTRTTWNDCNLNSGDCLTPKGFTFMRVRISDGVWVDLYNLHTDAGSDSGDITARASNLAQVTSYISQWSQGMPSSFISNNAVTDLWVSNIRLGVYPVSGADALVCDFPFASGTTQAQQVACEVVDKIFVHPVGGPHGDAFNDVATTLASSVPKITTVTIRGGNRVDAVSYGHMVTHGGTGGTANTLTLNTGEYIVKVYTCSGLYNDNTRVFYLQLTTNQGRTVQAGKTTSDCITTVVPTDISSGGKWGLVGAIWGAAY